MDMNLKQFRYVTVLADLGSFSRAAEELNISQPSLSQYVRKIENELGVSLFDRSGSSLRLTDAGRVYLEAGRDILDIERRMKNEFSDISSCRTGTITIGISPHRSICLLPPVIREFRKKYPGIQVIIDERVGQELPDRAERGEYDLCVTTLPVDETLFEYVSVRKDYCILAVPAGSETDGKLKKNITGEKNGYKAVDFKLLNGSDFVMLSESQLMQKILDNACSKYDISLNRIVECRSLEAELALVKEGVGPALLPSGMLRENIPGICCYSFIQDLPVREIVAVWRKGYKQSAAVKDFLNIMKKILLT